jgi:hypothetical protein
MPAAWTHGAACQLYVCVIDSWLSSKALLSGYGAACIKTSGEVSPGSSSCCLEHPAGQLHLDLSAASAPQFRRRLQAAALVCSAGSFFSF